MLILAVLGRMTLAARLSGTWAPPAPPPSISASKLSEMTAISRQTVRPGFAVSGHTGTRWRHQLIEEAGFFRWPGWEFSKALDTH